MTAKSASGDEQEHHGEQERRQRSTKKQELKIAFVGLMASHARRDARVAVSVANLKKLRPKVPALDCGDFVPI